MNTATQPLHELPPDERFEEIQASLRRLERRDWWLWILAVAVILLLTVGIASLSIPSLLGTEEAFYQHNLSQAVRGLVGLTLLYSTYTLYQQVMIKRLRHQLSYQLQAMHRLRDLAQQFEKLAMIDPLTGLYNRRFGEQRLSAEASRSQRHGHSLTLVAFDVNNLKRINDHYGHPAGDEVLKKFAEALSSAIRASDVAVRMGGDEFLVLLPECPAERAQAFLSRLHPIGVHYKGQTITVTFSAGWVSYRPGETPQQFLERVDQTLYADKRARKTLTSALPIAP